MTTDLPTLPREPGFTAQKLGASLTVDSLARSVAWYRDVIGFAVAREYAPRGTLIAVALRAGDVEVLLTQDNSGEARVKGQGFSLQLTTTQDIDALAAGIVARGGVLEDPPFDAGGARAFRLRDPDGFKLVFSSPRS